MTLRIYRENKRLQRTNIVIKNNNYWKWGLTVTVLHSSQKPLELFRSLQLFRQKNESLIISNMLNKTSRKTAFSKLCLQFLSTSSAVSLNNGRFSLLPTNNTHTYYRIETKLPSLAYGKTSFWPMTLTHIF